MTTKTTATEIADRLEQEFPPAGAGDDQWLARTVFQLLAKGEPVETGRLAGAVGRSEADVAATLAGPDFDPLVYRDESGRIIGFSGLGLAELGETVHRLKIDGRELYAWCAGDTLFIPATLEREARVESRCPVTGRPISLVVSPDGFSDVEPPSAVMSILSPEEVSARMQRGEDVIKSLCHWIFFFASEEAAGEWTSERPGTMTFPIEEFFEVGQRWIAHKWGIGDGR